MFDKGSESYKSDVKLGERYSDPQTGVDGVATAIYFFQYACERVQLERVNEKDGKVEEHVFDAPRLERVADKKPVGASRTGGPGDGVTGNASVRPSGPTR